MLLGALSLLFPILASGATTTDVAAGAETRISAGLIPINGTTEIKPGVELSLVPSVGIRTRSRLSALRLIYRPRFYLQIPNYIDSTRPLILHRLLADYSRALSPRTQFAFTAQGEAGEISYANLEDVFEPGTGAVQLRIIPLVITRGDLSLRHQLTRRSIMEVSWASGYRRPLTSDSQATDEDVRVFPTSYDASLGLNYSYRVDPTSTLGINARGGYLASTAQPAGLGTALPPGDTMSQTIAGGGGLNWLEQITDTDTLGFNLGGALTYFIEFDVLNFVPTANFTHSTQWGNGSVVWTSGSSGGVRGFLDRINATYAAQLFASWDLLGQFGPDWTSGARFFASTALQPKIEGDSQFGNFIRLSLPTNYRINQVSSLNFGVSASVRPPDNASNGALNQPDIVGFFGYQLSEGTGASHGAWIR